MTVIKINPSMKNKLQKAVKMQKKGQRSIGGNLKQEKSDKRKIWMKNMMKYILVNGEEMTRRIEKKRPKMKKI